MNRRKARRCRRASRFALAVRSGYDRKMRYVVDQPTRSGEAEIAAEVISSDGNTEQPGEQHRLVISVGDRTFDVEVLASGPRWLLRVADRPVEVVLQGAHCDVAGYSLRVTPEQARSVVAAHTKQTRVASPIAGRIVRLHHRDGAQVAAGEPLLVVEAMKMENELTSPCAGQVTFFVSEGQAVETGASLAEVIPG